MTTAASSSRKTSLHLKGHGDLPFSLQFSAPTKHTGAIPFLISWSGGRGEVALFGLFVPADAIAAAAGRGDQDQEFMAWLEAVRGSPMVTHDRSPAALRIMAIDIPPALEDIQPEDVLAAAVVGLSELIAATGEVLLTVELFQVEQRNPLRLSVMDRPLAEAWGIHYRVTGGLQLMADRRPIPGTAYSAPAVYGKRLLA